MDRDRAGCGRDREGPTSRYRPGIALAAGPEDDEGPHPDTE